MRTALTRELVGDRRNPLIPWQGPAERALLALTPRHLAFVDAYVRNRRNGTRAVMEVYGCTYGAAKVQAQRAVKQTRTTRHFMKVSRL